MSPSTASLRLAIAQAKKDTQEVFAIYNKRRQAEHRLKLDAVRLVFQVYVGSLVKNPLVP